MEILTVVPLVFGLLNWNIAYAYVFEKLKSTLPPSCALRTVTVNYEQIMHSVLCRVRLSTIVSKGRRFCLDHQENSKRRTFKFDFELTTWIKNIRAVSLKSKFAEHSLMVPRLLASYLGTMMYKGSSNLLSDFATWISAESFSTAVLILCHCFPLPPIFSTSSPNRQNWTPTEPKL